ncbi:hypothetical protein IC607_00915 [Cellulomonas sp. JH27-2]|uniref:hypothetical protein n=1 Tax=Cellulomonas sp. JH27-2 TaxID=2774139 RepID=UPI0017863435|nr:hypothetical protein [Cellulomonas sp. JH27-2]MBD8057529.1 hypothetical protein [Cellulomonas sp. JH27-2]
MHDAPHPRVLFDEMPDELFAKLAPYGATVGRLGVDVPVLHPSDWDLFVSFDLQPSTPDDVHVLSFGGDDFWDLGTDGWGTTFSPRLLEESHARSITAGPDPRFRALVERSIVETAPAPPRRVFSAAREAYMTPLATVGAEHGVVSFICTRRGMTDGIWTWVLPDYTTHEDQWLALMLNELRVHDPSRFPSEPDWATGPVWGAPQVREAARELANIAAERAQVIAALDERASITAAKLEQAAATAADGPQRLLTADGAALEAAVQDALGDLGFGVRAMDDHHDAVTGAKLEDLRVTDLDGAWTCLVEIKGYSKGARLGDISKIVGRPSTFYAAEAGRPADSVWHIVNAWRTADPSTREVALANDAELAPLVEAGGALIDTRDLFRAWRDVIENEARADDVRASLRTTSGRWVWPSTQGAAAESIPGERG